MAESELSRSDMRILFAATIIEESIFRRVRDTLGDMRLGDENAVYGLVLEDLTEFWNKHKSLPQIDMLRSMLQADLEADLAAEEGDADECSEVLSVAKSLRKTKRTDLAAYNRITTQVNLSLNTLIEEVHRKRLLEQISHGDLSVRLSVAQTELRAAISTNNNRFNNAFLDELDNRPIGRFTLIGNRLVDLYTGGTGPASGDIIGHAAPRGAGKSTLVNMVACDVASNERQKALDEKRSPRIVYVFNYEMIEGPLTMALSYMGNIPRAAVDDYIVMNTTDQFSSGKNYKPYEREKYGSLIRKAMHGKVPYPLAEFERLQNARQQLGTNLWLADFTGRNPAFKKMGEAFVNGIIEFIESHQLELGHPGVEAVFIDYAGTMVRTHMRTLASRNDSTERKLIEDLPLQLKQNIANPMRTFVWVAHQLAADEAGRKGGTRPDPNKFKDCKSFAENCDYAFVNGMPTKDGLAIFVQSKSRRGVAQGDQLGVLNGSYGCWDPVDAGFTVVGGVAMTADDARKLGGAGSVISPDEE